MPAFAEGEVVSLVSDAEDGVEREVRGLTVTPFSLPDGCLGAYYPEMNPLMRSGQPRRAIEDACRQIRPGAHQGVAGRLRPERHLD